MSLLSETPLDSGKKRSLFGRVRQPRLVLGALAVAGSLLAATTVSANAVTKSPANRSHATTVVADKSYFKGKTVTIYSFASVGATVDIAIRAIAPYMAAYLHCTVNVDTVAGGGTIPGQNLPAAQPPNGLTIGVLNIAGDIGDFVNNTPGLQFNLRSIPLISGLNAPSFGFFNTPASGLTSIKQMIQSPNPVTVLAQASSSSVVFEQLLIGGFHIPNKFIYGYPSASAILAGFNRGDGETTDQAYSTFASLVIGHQAIPVMQGLPAIKGELGYSIMRKVPDLAQAIANNPPKSKDGKAELAMLQTIMAANVTALFVPVGTASKFQAALSDAVQFATTRPGAVTQLISAGYPGGYSQAGPVKAGINRVIAQQSKLVGWLAATGAP